MRLIVFVFVAATFLFSGCSSTRPKFRKGTPGYLLGGPVGKNGFTLETDLGGYKDEKYSVLYGIRAVAEECSAKGFAYFDVAVIDPHHFEGYCFKTADHPALAVEFTSRGLDARPQHFVVSELHGKTKTKLETGDELLALEGKPIESVGLIKATIFRAHEAGKKSVTLKLMRGGQEMSVEEPIAVFKNSAMGTTQLDLIRSRVE